MRLLFVFFASPFGGAEKSLLTLSKILKNENIDVTYLFTKKCYLSEKIREYGNVKYMPQKIQKYFLSKKDIKSIKQLIDKMSVKILSMLGLLEKNYLKALKKYQMNDNFDKAICFFQNKAIMQFTINCVRSTSKAMVLHNSIHQDESMFNNEFFDIAKQFDKILCVSNSCKDELLEYRADLKGKVDVLKNPTDGEEIKRLSDEFNIEYDRDVVNIISVSRLAKEKGIIRSLKVMKKLHDEGYNFCWHICGDGNERSEIEDFIKDNNMEEYIKLYGFKKNPYPYIKAADAFYSGSYQEAAPMVYGEAILLNVPILSTNTTSAYEMVNKNGYVCENNEEAIYEMFKRCLNRDVLKKIKKQMKCIKINNKEIINKICEKW